MTMERRIAEGVNFYDNRDKTIVTQLFCEVQREEIRQKCLSHKPRCLTIIDNKVI